MRVLGAEAPALIVPIYQHLQIPRPHTSSGSVQVPKQRPIGPGSYDVGVATIGTQVSRAQRGELSAGYNSLKTL